ncbi:MAG: hypothetical protein OEU90_10810, partial [Gammaproteobacteria bacterium]|nr:hypothetical protein [Gammaproteobacteria bacterium]
MIRDARFWISMTVFQVLFGLAIFAVTRDYYVQDTDSVSAHTVTADRSVPVWPNNITENDIARLSSSELSQPTVQNPADMSRQADEY